MTDRPPLHVTCPCCQAILSVDPATGAVLSHEAPRGAAQKKDMSDALADLRKDKGRREDLFNQSLSVEKNKTDLLRKKFDEAVRKARENPDAPPPPREVD